MKTLHESILKDMESVMKDGDDIAAHQAAVKKEWADLKKIKVSEFEDWTYDEEWVYRYSWKCPAIIKEYFKEVLKEVDIASLDLFITMASTSANTISLNIAMCPVDSKDVGVDDSYEFYYETVYEDNYKKVLAYAVKLLKKPDIIKKLTSAIERQVEIMTW